MMIAIRINVTIIFILFHLQRREICAAFSKPHKIEISKPTKPVNDATPTTEVTLSTTSTLTSPLPTPSLSVTASPTTTKTATTTLPAPTKKPRDGPNEKNSSSKVSNPSSDIKQETSSTYMCSCDLKFKFCDTNCCCDVDCTPEMLKAFKCNNRSSKNLEHLQGLPSCDVNEGWLCIFKDNSRKVIVETYDPGLRSKRKFSWPRFYLSEEDSDLDHEHYVLGDPVLIHEERTSEIKSLDLPYPLVSPHCHVLEPIRHLVGFSRRCLMSLDDFRGFLFNFLDSIRSYKLLRSRKALVLPELVLDASHYIEMNSSICIHTDANSKCEILKNDTQFSEESCNRIDINLHHNFTELTAIQVSIVCNTLLDVEENSWKTFNIRFFQPNETTQNRTRISGKFGYNIGSPVIAGKHVPVSEDSGDNEKQTVINFFHANESVRDQLEAILLPVSISGLCIDGAEEKINFHENTLTQCSISYNDSSQLTATSNFTEICRRMQRKVFHYILNEEEFTRKSETYVSQLGSPRNISSNWILLQGKDYEARQAKGTFNEETEVFRCENMILNARYEFTTARIALNGLSHQNVIKKASVEVGKYVNLLFKLGEDITLPTYVSVMFYDATTSSSCRPVGFLFNTQIVYFLLVLVYLK